VIINTKHTERETVVTLAEDGGWPRYQAWVLSVAQDPDFVRFQFQRQEREGATWFEAPFVPRQLWEALARFYLFTGEHAVNPLSKTGPLRVNSVFNESTVASPVKLSPLERVVEAAMHNGAAFGDYVAAGVVYNTSVAGWDPNIYFMNELRDLSEQEKTFRECWGETYTQEAITQAILRVASIRRRSW